MEFDDTLYISESNETAALGHKKRRIRLISGPLSVLEGLEFHAPAPLCLSRDNKLVHKNKTYIIMLLIRAIPINRGLTRIFGLISDIQVYANNYPPPC